MRCVREETKGRHLLSARCSCSAARSAGPTSHWKFWGSRLSSSSWKEAASCGVIPSYVDVFKQFPHPAAAAACGAKSKLFERFWRSLGHSELCTLLLFASCWMTLSVSLCKCSSSLYAPWDHWNVNYWDLCFNCSKCQVLSLAHPNSISERLYSYFKCLIFSADYGLNLRPGH